MYNKNLPSYGALSNEFIAGPTKFIKYASSQSKQIDGLLIRCPCEKCDNLKFFSFDEVTLNLCRIRFIVNYFNWTYHGKAMWHEEQQFVVNQLPEHTTWWDQGFRDFEDTTPSFIPHSGIDVGASDCGCENPSLVHDEADPSVQPPHKKAKPHVDDMFIVFNVMIFCGNFIGLRKDVDKPLCVECETYTQLSLVAKLLSMKLEYNKSVNQFNENARVFKNSLPLENTLPGDFYGY